MSDFFFKIYRKKGFERTIDILLEKENHEYLETDFYQVLRQKKMHLNEFYRSKDDLIKAGIIAYRLNESFDKIIMLTQKGIDLKAKITELSELLNNKEEPINEALKNSVEVAESPKTAKKKTSTK